MASGPAAGLAVVAGLVAAAPAGAQELVPQHVSALAARHIGPEGNRTVAVAGVSGDPMVYYVGAATGGVWKTEDGGNHWEPVFDDQLVGASGALAVSPADPSVVWAGTGEPFIRSNVSVGDGIYKSTDSGDTWTRVGLEGIATRTSRIVPHPADPQVAYVAALGHAHGPQRERGIFRTTDGGETWEHVLFVDENTGASDLIMNPANPSVLIAGMWQVRVHQWTRESGGPGSGLFMTRDGGDTWRRLEGSELPKLPVGKIGLCTTPRDPDRVYALIETGDGVPWHGQETESGELWRSDDGGRNWSLVSHNRDLAGRSAYYTRCAVSPADEDEAYFLAAPYNVTRDGGATFENTVGRTRPGFDHHDMWIDPSDADRMAVAHDGGVSISHNRGKSWRRIQLPIAQMYHVQADNAVPYNVLGNRQDGPSARGPSRTTQGGFGPGDIPRGEWREVGGGESGFATADPTDPNIVWSSASGAGARGGIVVRHDVSTGQWRNVEVWPESTGGWPAEELRYRFQWTFPVVISPHDNNTIYVTSQHVHRTRNGGQTWEVASPDLSTGDVSRMGISGGLTPDNIGVEYCCVIYAFDESPVQEGVLWAGTNDGLVHVSRDGGNTWNEVTANLPDLPPNGVVRNIDASKWDAGTAYLSVEFHFDGNFDPYFYRTSDFGETWTKITDGIEPSPVSYARNILEDPVRPGLLYAGTESALYVSLDDGRNWREFMPGLPSTPYYWLVVQEHFNDLVIGTYGRGYWIIDDLGPLQQLTAEVAASEAHLFEPRDTYRFRETAAAFEMTNDPTAGENPPDGAALSYWLSAGTADAAPTVELVISDTDGEVRRLDGTANPGMNRVWWDLHGELTTEVKLRTPPPHAPWLEVGDDGERPIIAGRMSVLVVPGDYEVTLVVDGRERGWTGLTVLKDPRSEGTLADIAAQTAAMESIHDDVNRAAAVINDIELARKQLRDAGLVLRAREEGLSDLEAAIAGLDARLVAVEEQLYQMLLTGTGQDRVRWPAKVYGRLLYLAGAVGTADFPPTDQAVEVHAVLRERLENAAAEFEAVLESDLPALNDRLRAAGMPVIISARDQPASG